MIAVYCGYGRKVDKVIPGVLKVELKDLGQFLLSWIERRRLSPDLDVCSGVVFEESHTRIGRSSLCVSLRGGSDTRSRNDIIVESMMI